MTMRGGPGFGDDDDRLPWLETVEDDYSEGSPLWRTALLAAVFVAVLLVASAGYYWYQQQRSYSGTGELINAQDGDYKVKPERAGGMNAGGEGDSVYPTSEGEVTNASIDTSRAPEEPIEGKTIADKPVKVPQGAPKVVAAVPQTGGKLVVPTPKPLAKPAAGAAGGGAGGSVLQLGSFPSEAGANTAWTRMSKRFSYIAPLGHMVERAEVDGKTVFRLRVTAGTSEMAKDLCGRLKVAGENCFVAR